MHINGIRHSAFARRKFHTNKRHETRVGFVRALLRNQRILYHHALRRSLRARYRRVLGILRQRNAVLFIKISCLRQGIHIHLLRNRRHRCGDGGKHGLANIGYYCRADDGTQPVCCFHGRQKRFSELPILREPLLPALLSVPLRAR